MDSGVYSEVGFENIDFPMVFNVFGPRKQDSDRIPQGFWAPARQDSDRTLWDSDRILVRFW